MFVINVISIRRKRRTAIEKPAWTWWNYLCFASSRDLLDPQALLGATLDERCVAAVRRNGACDRTTVLGQLGDLHIQRVDGGLRRCEIFVQSETAGDQCGNDEPND